MVEIVPYQARWPAEFQQLASHLRQTLGATALRIDHIGSTSVPGLIIMAARDWAAATRWQLAPTDA